MENGKKLFLPPDGLELVLASGSPRRSDLLKQIGLENFLSDAADIDETIRKLEAPKKYAARVALEKAETSDLILILSDDEDFSYPELKSTCKKILVHTKSDLKTITSKGIHNISVKDNIGIQDLINSIVPLAAFDFIGVLLSFDPTSDKS